MISGRSLLTACNVLILSLFLVACGGDGDNDVVFGSGAGGSVESASVGESSLDADEDVVADIGEDAVAPGEGEDKADDADTDGFDSDSRGGIIGDAGENITNDSDDGVSESADDTVIVGDVGDSDVGNDDSESEPEVTEPTEPTEPDNVSFDDLLSTSVEPEAFGYVIDSAVSGLRYKSGGHYGITDSDGKFGYLHGETVEFFIGDIRVGMAIEPVPLVTPYELAEGDARMALNIARFLQTLDNDAIPGNGIHIHDAVHVLAAGLTLEFLGPGWEPGSMYFKLELVDGQWVTSQTQSPIELTVFELTSATEAGARYLTDKSTAYAHLSNTLLGVIGSRKAEAIALMEASTCEVDAHCKVMSLATFIDSGCGFNFTGHLYSEIDTDVDMIEVLESERVYLDGVRRELKSVLPPSVIGRGSIRCSVTPRFSRIACGESKRCERIYL